MIPKHFQLMGHTITVRVVPQRRWHAKDAQGLWEPAKCRISILSSLSDQQRQQTFCHELVHAILDYQNHALRRDESFVDTFAGLLHQAWVTIDLPQPKRSKHGRS